MNSFGPFFQLSTMKVWPRQSYNTILLEWFQYGVMHDSSPDGFQAINIERRRRNFRKKLSPINEQLRFTASKDLERTSRMRYVFPTGCSCSFNSLWKIIWGHKSIDHFSFLLSMKLCYNICISARTNIFQFCRFTSH